MCGSSWASLEKPSRGSYAIMMQQTMENSFMHQDSCKSATVALIFTEKYPPSNIWCNIRCFPIILVA